MRNSAAMIALLSISIGGAPALAAPRGSAAPSPSLVAGVQLAPSRAPAPTVGKGNTYGRWKQRAAAKIAKFCQGESELCRDVKKAGKAVAAEIKAERKRTHRVVLEIKKGKR
jgi:hypothetical protein